MQWPEENDLPKYFIEEKLLADLFLPPISEDLEVSVSSNNSNLEEGANPEGDEIPEEGAAPGGEDSMPIDELVVEKYFLEKLSPFLPLFELFEDYGSLLPDKIDLEEFEQSKTDIEGYRGVENFLAVLKIETTELKSTNMRLLENKIRNWNTEITNDFRIFWKQTVGKSNKVSIKFQVEKYGHDIEGKAGKPYLVFWVEDGEEMLFPVQRSRGLRWFLSFYLHMKKISLENTGAENVILIDEPGGSLHQKAQEDVLKVFENTKKGVHIIYTTHSQHLLRFKQLFSILAVQRAEIDEKLSDTKIFGAHEFTSASQDTLSPLLSLMGIDFSSQNVVKKDKNIILEEISSYYYFSSFMILANSSIEAYFIPAVGNTNVIQLAYLLLGWGLKFGVILDDDPSGKKIHNELKENLYGTNPDLGVKNLKMLDGCLGVEDMFTKVDFRNHVMEDPKLVYSVENSKYVSSKNLPKAMIAAKFFLRVENKNIKMTDLSSKTKMNIRNLLVKIKRIVE